MRELDLSEESDKIEMVLHDRSGRPLDDKGKARLDYVRSMDYLVGQVSNHFGQLLGSMRYLGPLRLIPPRHLVEMDDQTPNWQSGGGDAWSKLKGDAQLLETVKRGLAVLKMPYELKVRELVDAQQPGFAGLSLLSLEDRRSGVSLSHRDVGIGVSQIIPVIITLSSSQRETILIEQPEIHLQPAAQADLGDLFIQSALGGNRNTVILETHSEHLILRIMRRIRETNQNPEKLPAGFPAVNPADVSILYVEADGQRSIVREMPINNCGELVKAWPGGFFEESYRELFE